MLEIVLSDDVKPAVEWVNDRIVQKVSPARKHSLAQGRFFAALETWAREHCPGTVGTEWRFQVWPRGEIGRTLVPDVAFLSYDRMPLDEQELTDSPAMAPDAVVEVLSDGDLRRDVDEKIRVYLSAGTNVVFLVDTKEKTVTVRDAEEPVVLGIDDLVGHRSLPGLTFPVRRLFDPIPPRGV
jgi:Uma2 family endonuclease